MKNVLFCTLLTLFFSCPVFAGTIKDNPIYVEGEVMVILRAPAYEKNISMDAYSQLLLDQAETFAKKYGLELFAHYHVIARYTGKFMFALRSKNKSTDELIKELSPDPDVISVSPIYIYQEPTPVPKSGGGCNTIYGVSLLLLSGLMPLAINGKI